MFNQGKEKFSLRKLKSGTSSVKIGFLALGVATSVALGGDIASANEPNTVAPTATAQPGNGGELNVSPAATAPTPIPQENVKPTDTEIPLETIALGRDVSAKVTDKTTSSQIVGGNKLNHYSLFYNEYNGTLNNTDKSLKAGDYFKIELDKRVGLDGVTVYNGGYASRPAEEIYDSKTDELALNSYYNKDDHSLYYVFTPEAAKSDIVKWTVFTTDTVNYKVQTSNGDVTFTNNYAGTPVNYSGKVEFHANNIHHPENYGMNVEHVIAETDIAKQRYTQYFTVSPQKTYENSTEEVKFTFGTKDNITPAKNLDIKVYAVPQNQPYLDSFHVDPSYKEITSEVVKDGVVTFANGFSSGFKYLIKLENDFVAEKGINSTLTGG